MTEHVSDLSEKQVQELIADHPWLLSIDYERVPDLDRRGMEISISDQKRLDLILRDKRTGRPVLVEFKAEHLNRGGIGQIIEYRARVLQELSRDDSTLVNVFGEMVAVPILILVVPTCCPEARLACNLTGIEVYEYIQEVPEWSKPETFQVFEEFRSYLDQTTTGIPFEVERNESIERIYKEIHNTIANLGLDYQQVPFRYSSQEYIWELNHFFLNKWIFKEERVSIGIYEDLFESPYRIVLEFCSRSESDLREFIEKYREIDHLEPSMREDGRWYLWSHELPQENFLEVCSTVITPFLSNYKAVMQTLGWLEQE